MIGHETMIAAPSPPRPAAEAPAPAAAPPRELSAPPVILIAGDRWDNPLWTNRHHIGSRLAAFTDVLFVETPVHYSDLARGQRLSLPQLRQGSAPGGRLHTLRPLSPFPLGGRLGVSARLNRISHIAQVRRAAHRLGFHRPLLWVYAPEADYYAGRLGERLAFYHCVDDFPAQAALTGRSAIVRAAEARLLANVDVVAVTSPTLLDRRPRGGEAHLLPNVADVQLFGRAREALPQPPELAGVSSSIVGFWGALDRYKVDFALLAAVAERYPEVTFALVGPQGVVDRTAEPLPERPNLRYLPAKAPADLPAFARRCDALMIPYVRNAYTNSVFPLKVYEYFATGKPVVSTPLPSIQGLAPLITFAEGPDAFAAAIRSALRDDTPERQARRIALAGENSWEKRLQSIIELLRAHPGWRSGEDESW